MNDKEFIQFLMELLGQKIRGFSISDDDWHVLSIEMRKRNFSDEEYFNVGQF